MFSTLFRSKKPQPQLTYSGDESRYTVNGSEFKTEYKPWFAASIDREHVVATCDDKVLRMINVKSGEVVHERAGFEMRDHSRLVSYKSENAEHSCLFLYGSKDTCALKPAFGVSYVTNEFEEMAQIAPNLMVTRGKKTNINIEHEYLRVRNFSQKKHVPLLASLHIKPSTQSITLNNFLFKISLDREKNVKIKMYEYDVEKNKFVFCHKEMGKTYNNPALRKMFHSESLPGLGFATFSVCEAIVSDRSGKEIWTAYFLEVDQVKKTFKLTELSNKKAMIYFDGKFLVVPAVKNVRLEVWDKDKNSLAFADRLAFDFEHFVRMESGALVFLHDKGFSKIDSVQERALELTTFLQGSLPSQATALKAVAQKLESKSEFGSVQPSSESKKTDDNLGLQDGVDWSQLIDPNSTNSEGDALVAESAASSDDVSFSPRRFGSR